MGYVRQVGPDGVARLRPNYIGWLITEAQEQEDVGCCVCPCIQCDLDDDNITANLVTNGSFEDDAGTPDANVTVSPSGWTVVQGVPSVIKPDSGGTANGYPGVPDGDQFLMGGYNAHFDDPPPNATSVVEQVIDLSAYATAIDNGQGCYYFAAKIGAYGDGDYCTIQLIVGGVTVYQVSAIFFGFLNLSHQGRLPVGTTSVTIRWTAVLSTSAGLGYSTDGYLDDVQFYLCPGP